jgi:hypothetical protein
MPNIEILNSNLEENNKNMDKDKNKEIDNNNIKKEDSIKANSIYNIKLIFYIFYLYLILRF